MKKLLAVALVSVVAVPFAVQGASGQTGSTKEKRICEVNQPTGSRLGAVRRCRTKAERDAARAEGKGVTDRIQSQKNFGEAMVGMRNCNGGPTGC